MRFLITFIISGFIYYSLYQYTPEFFTHLVSFADAVVQQIQSLVANVAGSMNNSQEAANQILPFLGLKRK